MADARVIGRGAAVPGRVACLGTAVSVLAAVALLGGCHVPPAELTSAPPTWPRTKANHGQGCPKFGPREELR